MSEVFWWKARKEVTLGIILLWHSQLDAKIYMKYKNARRDLVSGRVHGKDLRFRNMSVYQRIAVHPHMICDVYYRASISKCSLAGSNSYCQVETIYCRVLDVYCQVQECLSSYSKMPTIVQYSYYRLETVYCRFNTAFRRF